VSFAFLGMDLLFFWNPTLRRTRSRCESSQESASSVDIHF